MQVKSLVKALITDANIFSLKFKMHIGFSFHTSMKQNLKRQNLNAYLSIVYRKRSFGFPMK